MKYNIAPLLSYKHKRYFILVVAALMCQINVDILTAATNQVVQVQHQTKHLKIGKDGKYIKRKYPQTYHAMREFALRSASSASKQQDEFEHQVMAFRALEKAWNKSKPESAVRKGMKIGLLRWGWLQGDPILNNQRPIDWYMVYMECIAK